MEGAASESAALEDVEPIFELAIECERLFAEQIARLKGDSKTNEATILSELNERFAAWAAFLGVFAESKVCLDRRLRHHVEIQEQVLHLMAIMIRNLPFVFKEDNSFEPIDVEHAKEQQHLDDNVENLEAISEAIERLNYIGIAIRQSSATSHTAKAREFTETFDSTSFDGLAYLALKTMYFAASEELLELLTQSMTDTYAWFLRRKARREQLVAPRSRTHTPFSIHTVSEESAADADLDPQTSQRGRNPTAALLRNPPPSRQLSKPMLSSEPTSLDIHEFEERNKKTWSPSQKGGTTSILYSQADYPRPAKGSKICCWCFALLPIDPSDQNEWQKHVNEDNKPYLCISEKCPDSSPRFTTSREWLKHMLKTHGQNWHREAFPTSSWICPLCNNDDTIFPIADELASHLADSHGEVFARPEIQAIVQQSRIRSPRSRNECLLCCLSLEDQQDSPSKEDRKGKLGEPTSTKSRENSNVDRSRKHTKTEAVYTEMDEHIRGEGYQARTEQQLQESKTKAKPPPARNPTVESIGSHIAGHLQAVMALTLRIINIDGAIGDTADSQSVSGDTDNSSRGGWIRRSLDQESDDSEDFPIPEDGDITFDGPQPEAIPDSEYFDWNNMRPDCGGSTEDEFLQDVINSGALQSHLGEGADVKFGSALRAASKSGSESVVRLLLDKGADANVAGGQYSNALQAASASGSESVVQLLLDKGADVNSTGGKFGSALQAASKSGSESLVQLLLNEGADVNVAGGKYGSALQAASKSCSESVVQLLLNKGTEVNVAGGKFGSALQAASKFGSESVVRLLLDKGADVNVAGGQYGNALQAASASGSESVVQLLLDKGADVNRTGGKFGSALQAAAKSGSGSLVQRLLDKGADVNVAGGKYGSALQAASASGSKSVVQLLLDSGADVNSTGGKFGSALQAASKSGSGSSVQLLLDEGADVNVAGGKYGSALQAASKSCSESVVQLRLNKEIDVNVAGRKIDSALQEVRLLLDKGADVNTAGGEFGSALQAASHSGHTSVVQLLLDNGADVNRAGGDFGSALQAASYSGHKSVVELLLDNGADVNVAGGEYGSALQAASNSGVPSVVQLLLENGADVNVSDGENGTALDMALSRGHKAIVQLLEAATMG
ncbi:hypothetical protein MMC07_000016 [Pseudocyphellaria aurata]|nr:hypothetical protein [Pseudocyphellaria aurata]